MKHILTFILLLGMGFSFISCTENTARKRCEYFATQTLSDVQKLYPNVKITDREVLFDGDIAFVCRYHYGTQIIPNGMETNKVDQYSQVYVYFVGKGDNNDALGIYTDSEFQQAYILAQSIDKDKALAEACRMLMLNKSREISDSEIQKIK